MKTCSACGTDNDDTRVFCLNCAERLPAPTPGSLPGIPKSELDPGMLAPPVTQVAAKSQKNILLPGKLPTRRRTLRGMLFALWPLFVVGGLAWMVYLAAQPPENLTPPVSSGPQDTSTLAAFFQKAVATPGGAWMAGEKSINQFLEANVPSQTLMDLRGVKCEFKRCFVQLGEGTFDFVMQFAVLDHDLYLLLVLKPDPDSPTLKLIPIDGAFGRLPVHLLLIPYLTPLLTPCLESLKEVIDPLRRAQSATITPKSVVIRWPKDTESSR
jgi:hypothetical protein